MLHGFKDYLLDLRKSENTVAAYLRDAKLFLTWCKDSFGDEPKLLHRANIQEYISYMRNVRGYHPKTVKHHLSSLRSLNEYLITSGRQTEAAVLDSDFMKIQIQYASPCTVEKRTWRRSASVFWKAEASGTFALSRSMLIPGSGAVSASI